jgi:hypothetical protein
VNDVSPVTEPCDQVTVAFTRDQVLALFGLLQWANQHSYGLAVKGVRCGTRGSGCRPPAPGQPRPRRRRHRR